MKIRIALFALLSMLSTSFAFAAAVVQSASGDVTMEVAGVTSELAVNQNVASGTTIRTGKDGHVMLRFDDGQMTALSTNTVFKINNYRYNPAKPAEGNVALSILKGALRMVTGFIGKFNHSAFSLNTPVATIGIRGTDFMVGLYDSAGVDPADVQTLHGTTTVTNGAGTSIVPEGTIAQIAGPNSLAVSVAAPNAAVSTQFSQLSSANMGAGAAGAQSGSGGTTGGGSEGAAGGGASGAAVGGGVSGGAIAVGAGIAVGAAAISNNNSTTATTGTTP